MNHVARTPLRVRHRPRLRLAQVVRVEQISPSMRRISFGGGELAEFVSASPDDHVKVFFPLPGQERPSMPDMGPDGVIWPEGAPRGPLRDYTPRSFDPEHDELAIEFVIHGGGPASAWAAQAQPGQWLGIGGPRSSLLVPDDYETYVLVADETGLPAVARRLEELQPGAAVRVLIEVEDAREERALPTAASASVTWLHRDGIPAGTPDLLLPALRDLSFAQGDSHVWIACEIEVARSMRRHLIEERGLRRDQIRAVGYWRHGVPGGHGKVED